jgi:hypothetical protein
MQLLVFTGYFFETGSIDWVIHLPRLLQLQFWQDVRDFEEQRHMPYITSVQKIGEQIGFERGIQEGQ